MLYNNSAGDDNINLIKTEHGESIGTKNETLGSSYSLNSTVNSEYLPLAYWESLNYASVH